MIKKRVLLIVVATSAVVAACGETAGVNKTTNVNAAASNTNTNSSSLRSSETRVVNVPANEPWHDTGITLASGETLTIHASGRWSNVGNNFMGPNGSGGIWPGTILTSGNLGSLIGRVDDDKFYIGDHYSGSTRGGRLFLAMNDVPGTYGDNAGALNVQIRVGGDSQASTSKPPPTVDETKRLQDTLINAAEQMEKDAIERDRRLDRQR